MMERCELTDLLKNQCAHCLKHELGDEETTKQSEINLTFEGLLKEQK